MDKLNFQAKVYIYSSPCDDAKSGSRWFVNLPVDISIQLHDIYMKTPRRGGSSIRVIVQIALLSRETSIFRDTTRQCYLLPIKADIRKQLHISEPDMLLDIDLDILW